jgi:mono/diheme cytochrome c family protein/Tfp pilus assembly protein PilF
MRRPLLWIAAMMFLAAAATWGVRRWSDYQRDLARLPPVPDLATATMAVARHIREADAAARRRPSSPDAVGALGIAYHADGFHEYAARCYAHATDLAPDDWRWHYHHALLDIARGRLERVPDRLQEAVAREPSLAIAWFRLAEERFKRGLVDEAENDYSRALNASKGPAPGGLPRLPARHTIALSSYAQLGLARIALLRNDTERALKILERLVLEAPDFGSAHRLLAQAWTVAGERAEAARHLAHAEVLHPYTPPADPVLDRLAVESRSAVTLLSQAAVADRAGDGTWKERLVRLAGEYDPKNPAVMAQVKLLEAWRSHGEAWSKASGGDAPSSSDGQALYSASCAVCHQESGQGQIGKAPPLAGSPQVPGPGERLVRIVLEGLQTPLSGAVYATGMPAMRSLRDEQVAAVLTYVRRRWGAGAAPVHPDLVRRVRQEIEPR